MPTPPEQIVRDVHWAKAEGFTIERACRVIMLEPLRLRRWVRRAGISSVPWSAPAREDRSWGPEHQPSREWRVLCSESSVLKALRAAVKVSRYTRRRRPKRSWPQEGASVPHACWGFDVTTFPTLGDTPGAGGPSVLPQDR